MTTIIELDHFKARHLDCVRWISERELLIFNAKQIYIFNLDNLSSTSSIIPRLLVTYDRERFDSQRPQDGSFLRIEVTSIGLAILTTLGSVTIWSVEWNLDSFCPLPILCAVPFVPLLDCYSRTSLDSVYLLSSTNQHYKITQYDLKSGERTVLGAIHVPACIVNAAILFYKEQLILGFVCSNGQISIATCEQGKQTFITTTVVDDKILGPILFTAFEEKFLITKFNCLYIIWIEEGKLVIKRTWLNDERFPISGLLPTRVDPDTLEIVCLTMEGSVWQISYGGENMLVQKTSEPWGSSTSEEQIIDDESNSEGEVEAGFEESDRLKRQVMGVDRLEPNTFVMVQHLSNRNTIDRLVIFKR